MKDVNKKLKNEVPVYVVKDKVNCFLDENGEVITNQLTERRTFGKYDDLIDSFRRNYIDAFYSAGFDSHMTYDKYYDQVFSILDLYPSDFDPYETMLDTVEKIYGPLTGKTIINFQPRPFAAIAHVALKRVGKDGKIIIVDPLLISKNVPKGVTISSDGLNGIDVEDDAIVISDDPCERTSGAIRFGAIHNLNLFISNWRDRYFHDSTLEMRRDEHSQSSKGCFTGLYDGTIQNGLDLQFTLLHSSLEKKVDLDFFELNDVVKRGDTFTKCAEQYALNTYSDDFEVNSGIYSDKITGWYGESIGFGTRSVIYTKKIGTRR